MWTKILAFAKTHPALALDLLKIALTNPSATADLIKVEQGTLTIGLFAAAHQDIVISLLNDLSTAIKADPTLIPSLVKAVAA